MQHAEEDVSSSEEEESEDEAPDDDREEMKEKLQEALDAPRPDPDLKIDEWAFSVAVSVITVANLFVLGARADMKCAQGSYCDDGIMEYVWVASDHLFTFLFVVEMIVRIVESHPRRFFLGDRTKVVYKINGTNCVDFLIVFLRVLDVWMLTPAGVESGLKNISAFRIMRLMQLVHHLRMYKACTELWLVLASIHETVKTLVWNGALILLTTWILAILIRMALMNFDGSGKSFDMRRAEWNFDDYWGSVGACFLSLVQLLFKDRWGDVLIWPLIEKHTELILVFAPFYCIGGLALMSSVTAVVVECTLTASKDNVDRESEERDKVDQLVMQSLRDIFMEADTDGSGELDREELHEAMRSYRVKDRLKHLQLPFRDLDMLFLLLDDEGSGLINCDKFFRGVAKLRGPAKACDLHQMSIDLRKNQHVVEVNLQNVVDTNDVLAGLLGMIDDMETGILRSDTDGKDPVLMSRRQRGKIDWNKRMRGKWGEEQIREGSKDPWMSWEDAPAESKDIPDEAVKVKRAKTISMDKGTTTDKTRRKKAKKELEEAQATQPAPPPLPPHLQVLKVNSPKKSNKRRP